MPALRPWKRRRVPRGTSAGATVQPLEPRTLLTGFTLGYYNSIFWGTEWNVYPADPDPTDGAVPGTGSKDVGSIRLNPANPAIPPDPADPLGIAAADPDAVTVIDSPNVFSSSYVRNNRPASIDSQLSVIYTGSVTIPTDSDGVPNEEVSVAFNWSPSDFGHTYIDGRLVRTNPGGGTTATMNVAPANVYREGQSLDVVILGVINAFSWSFGGGNPIAVAGSFLSPTPRVPQKSGITLSGEPTARQVSFAIDDRSTSEQRFDLYRKPAGAPDADYVKVNEAGINSPLITDASAAPGTSYTYVLRGYNFASGNGEASDPVTVTTAAEPAPGQGLHAYYYNDEFWAQGPIRPLPRLGNLFAGGGLGVGGPDVHEIVTSSSLDFGGVEQDPSVRPGGSPSPLIRDTSHSILLAGKLLVTDPGDYQVLGFGDDDTYVFVDNTLASSHPFIHTPFDPRVGPYDADHFTRPVHLDAGEHDVLVLNVNLTRTSFVSLQWIRLGQTAPEPIPAANLRTDTAAPAAPSAPQATELRGTSALITFGDNATNEWKNLLVVARDAAFTQDVRVFPVGILAGTDTPGVLRVMNLAPNTHYFAKHIALNSDGEASSPVTGFDTGDEQVPYAPTGLVARPLGPGEVNLTWNDVAFDETGFVVRRRMGNGAFEDIATLPADSRGYLDTPDPARVPLESSLEYQVVAANNAGRSAPSQSRSLTFGGPGGTGLRQRIWDNINSVSREGVGAPTIDRVDGIVNHTWGFGPPAPGIGADTFAVEWVGEIVAEETKAYDFSVIMGGGARLFINDALVIAGGWGDYSNPEFFAEPVFLTAGQKVEVRLQYYKNAGSGTARLRWNRGGDNAREDVPSVFLFPVVDPTDAVGGLSLRSPTDAYAFGLPPVPGRGRGATIDLHWQDNAFGETGYQIQRATDAAFTQNLTARPNAPAGADRFVDDGPIDRGQTYFYRLRALGATDPAAWVVTGPVQASHFEAGRDFTLTDFRTPRYVTGNGQAGVTAENTLKVAEKFVGGGSAFLNSSFDVASDFKVNFDFQISDSGGGDGMTFVIHNNLPTGAGTSQLNTFISSPAGSDLGYRGISSSVAVTFDFHDDIDQLGLFTNGTPPPQGHVAATRINDPAQYPLAAGGTIDLRLPENGAIDLNGGTVYDFTGIYDNTAKVLTIEIRLAGAEAGLPPLFSTKIAIDIAATVGGDEAVMGWTAANGGEQSRYEVLDFSYDGPNVAKPTAEDSLVVQEVYVRGSTWIGQDNNPATTTFMEHLAEKGLGHDTYGYRLFGPGRTPSPQNPDDVLPWINMDQLVVRFASVPTGAGVPTAGPLTLKGMRSSYTVTAVTPVAGDPTAFILSLNKPLGGGNPAAAAAPTADENGDIITLTVPSAGPAGSDFTLTMNVLQGDTDHLNESTAHAVLARDFSEVKKRFFKNTRSTVAGDDTDYSIFHDVDASGSILAADYSEVKKRFFHSLSTALTMQSFPPAGTSAGSLLLEGTTRELFAAKAILA